MPITPEEAYARTNPEDSDEVRQQAAQNIIAGIAANDAYINSRGELEQIAIRLAGGQHPPTFEEQNKEDNQSLPGTVEGTAVAEPAPGAALPATAPATVTNEAEIATLKARIAELQGQGGGQ